MKSNIKKCIFVSVLLIISLNNVVIASQAKWDAYPEWGDMLKINIISLNVTIISLILQCILDIFKKRKKVEKLEKVCKFTNVIVYILSLSTIISSFLVKLDVYENAFIIYLVGIVFGSIFIMLLSKNKKFNNNICVLIILLIIFFSYKFSSNLTFPYEIDHTNDMDMYSPLD